MSHIEEHRKTWPGKSDEWLFDRLANELSDKVDRINKMNEELVELISERDEADRRAGYAERMRSYDQDRIQKHDQWNRQQKEAAGYEDYVSFDVVWKDTLEKAKRYDAMNKAKKES